MRHDQLEVFELRKQGKTYREIQKLLGISRSTLSEWLKDKEWSKHIRKSNIERNVKIGTENINRMNEGRRRMLEAKYEKVVIEAEQEFELYKNDPLFMAGLMVYAGEGDKTNRFNIRVANSEFYLHLVFIRFSENFLKTSRDRIKVWLLLYPDHNIEECLNIWSEKLGIRKSNFTKSQVILGKSKLRTLQYGVGNSIISSTSLKKKMLKWLELCRLYFK